MQVLCDVHCQWEGLPPIYRVYVNNELFTERTWIWDDSYYLEEMLQISAPAGEYTITYELVPPHLAHIEVKNMRIEIGDAVIKNNKVRIRHEN